MSADADAVADAVRYADATPADAAALATMAAASFIETFGHLYAAADLAAFLDKAYGPAGLPAQIGDPAYAVRVARAGAAIVGYAKLGPVDFPGDWDAGAVALHQLYVLDGWQGRGVADALMAWALDHARRGGAHALLLSVWAENARARAFYRRRGFEEVGRYDFVVGTQIDDDRILRLAL